MTTEETKEFIDKNFNDIVDRYIDAVEERGKEKIGPEFKLTNDLREKINDFVNETIEIFKNKLGDVGQASVEDFMEFVKDRFETAGSPDVIDTLLEEDDDLDVDNMMRSAAAEDENAYDRNTYGDNTKTDAVSTIVAPVVNLAKKKLKEKLVEFMVKKAAEKFGNLSDNVIDDIVGYVKQLADVCKNDEKTMETIFNEGYGSIPSYKDALNWILEKGTSEDLKAEGENLFDAVKKPCLDAAEGAEDSENKQEFQQMLDQDFRSKVYNAIDLVSGPAADKYFDLLVDVAKRAVSNIEHRGHEDFHDAAWSAINESMIRTDDQWLIMQYFQSPSVASFQDALESMAEDIVKVLEAVNGADEEDEEADDQNP
jgi:hypothetical protein